MEENKMGVKPVKPLIVGMALPMMLSMLVQALYNIVDSYFVAKVSEDAVTAVTLAFPMQNLMISIGMGTCVGVNALLSKALGQKNKKAVDDAANTGLLLTAVHFVLFLIIGFFLSSVFIHSQTDNAQIASYAISYLKIISVMSFGCFFQVMFERLLQSTGKTQLSMISQMSGAIINMVLDPIMIFGLYGFPRMEVAGAAVATCIGQVCACVIGFVLNIKYNRDISISLSKMFKPHFETIKKVYIIGIPSTLMMAIGSLMTYFMNLILGGFSSTAQAVFGIYFRLQSFFFMPVFGLNNALIPVLAYNFGAKRKDRIMEALKFTVVVAVCIMLTGTATFMAIPKQLLLIFEASEEMLAIGVTALRIIGLNYPMAAVAIVLGSVFQAFAKSQYSFFTSVARQLVVLIPVAWLLAQTGVISNVWWAFPISEVVSLAVTFVFFKKVKKEVVDPLEA